MMPFLCNQYENPSELMKWSAVACMTADPIGRLLTTWIRHEAILFQSLVVLGLISTVLVLAWRTPPIPLSRSYRAIPVVLNTTCVFTFAYTQTMIYLTIKKKCANKSQGQIQWAYEFAALACQIGGLVGAMLSFSLVALKV